MHNAMCYFGLPDKLISRTSGNWNTFNLVLSKEDLTTKFRVAKTGQTPLLFRSKASPDAPQQRTGTSAQGRGESTEPSSPTAFALEGLNAPKRRPPPALPQEHFSCFATLRSNQRELQHRLATHPVRSARCPLVPGFLAQGASSAPKPRTIFLVLWPKSSGNSLCTLSVLSQCFLFPTDNCCALFTPLEMRVCQHKGYKPLHIGQDSRQQRVLVWFLQQKWK